MLNVERDEEGRPGAPITRVAEAEAVSIGIVPPQV
jgi:hypothetical protein